MPGSVASAHETVPPRTRGPRERHRLRVAAAALGVAGLACLGTSIGLALSGSSTSSAAPPPTTAGPAGIGVAAGPFAGTWSLGSYVLTIGADGDGDAQWAGPPGGHAAVSLSSVSGGVADGTVSGTTEASVLPDGPAVFRLLEHGHLLSLTPSSGASSPFAQPLCSPAAKALTPSEQQHLGITCD